MLQILIRQIPNLMKGSWRTTLVGILGAVSILIAQAVNLLDADPDTVFSLEAVMAALAIFGIGRIARDNGVSSETAGAK